MEGKLHGRSPEKSGNTSRDKLGDKSRDKLGEKTEVEAKVKRHCLRPNLLRRSSKTSPKKYKDFGEFFNAYLGA